MTIGNQGLTRALSHAVLTVVGVVVLAGGIYPLAAQADQCTLAQTYARSAQNAGSTRDKVDALERAVAVCPTWQYWQELGLQAAAAGDRPMTARAAEAFAEAYPLAANDNQRAASSAQYGAVLLASGDPQAALQYVYHARNLAPATPGIEQLAADVRTQIATVDTAQIKRGLGNALFKPLVLKKQPAPALALAPEKEATTTVAPVTLAPVRAIQVPIRFEVNSVKVSAQTQRNLEVLAATLADDQFAEDSFLLIGHADTRGDEGFNLSLSHQRAAAIRDAMIQLEPRLDGRLRTEGRGESQPISRGESPMDHELNRRLEVIITPGT